MLDKKYYDGFWNGEAAKFRVVDIIVGEESKENKEHFEKHYPNQKKYLWFVPFIGKTLQAIEITYQGSVWCIDNCTGSGLYKVTKGLGSPNCGHASIYAEFILKDISESEWIYPSKELNEKREKETYDYWMEKDSEGYKEHLKKIESLMKTLKTYLQ